jgi:hypothetical protein
MLFRAVGKCVDRLARFRCIITAVASVEAVFALAMIGRSLPEKILVSILVLLAFAATAWFALLAADERPAIQGLGVRLLPPRLRPKPIGA